MEIKIKDYLSRGKVSIIIFDLLVCLISYFYFPLFFTIFFLIILTADLMAYGTNKGVLHFSALYFNVISIIQSIALIILLSSVIHNASSILIFIICIIGFISAAVNMIINIGALVLYKTLSSKLKKLKSGMIKTKEEMQEDGTVIRKPISGDLKTELDNKKIETVIGEAGLFLQDTYERYKASSKEILIEKLKEEGLRLTTNAAKVGVILSIDIEKFLDEKMLEDVKSETKE